MIKNSKVQNKNQAQNAEKSVKKSTPTKILYYKNI